MMMTLRHDSMQEADLCGAGSVHGGVHAKNALRGIVLYSSFQKGSTLPGYVRYALAGIASSGFKVVLLTVQDDLDKGSSDFLEAHRIELFTTINRGFDFGMWRRYVESVPVAERIPWERIVLMNDSVVYYRNVIVDFLKQAEEKDADAVSLSSNKAYGYHLQSFFLYMKPPAARIFLEHLLTTPEQPDYWSTVVNMEIGLSRRMLREGLVLKPLFRTRAPFDFSYAELIRGGSGFVKRKLLESRYTFGQAMFFMRNNARGFTADYEGLILRNGNMDADFDPAWLETRPPFTFREKFRMGSWVAAFWVWKFISCASTVLLAAVIAWLAKGVVGDSGAVVAFCALAAMGIWLLGYIRRRMDHSSMKPIDGLPDPDYS